MVDSIPVKDSGRKLFFGLFIFPLLIAVGMAVLLCTVVLLTREVETPESLISAIKSGSESKRWQKAFELSNELNQGRGMIRESGVMNEIIHILSDQKEYDAKTRAYMAIALSRFEEPEVVGALRAALAKEESPSVQLYLIWALGIKNAGEAAEDVEKFLSSERDDLRQMAAYVLGSLGSAKSAISIRPLLEDAVRDVRWNAALSLARLGNDEGYSVIMNMLDRDLLSSQDDLDNAKIEEIMVNAIKGAALIKRADLREVVKNLADHDQSLKVRQAAIEALKH